ncbi:hypothetical protein ACP4OV_025231 [Aristida adscensionis]
MVDPSRAVHWWEEWQLRVLVLGSMFIQWFLAIFAMFRKRAIPSWFRFLIWLAYIGSDALAIYALATLFNRHKTDRQDGSFPHRSNLLEVLWAPILLVHIGGSMAITAYNIEDNELWQRHFVTVISQIIVAIYVFCKSWPAGGDKLLLLAAKLCFVHGIVKCLRRPMFLMLGSVFGLLSSTGPAISVTTRRGEISSVPLECFVREARAFIQAGCPPQTVGDVSIVVHREPLKLILDLISPYPGRLRLLKYFWLLEDHEAYDKLRTGLSRSFDLIYTRRRIEVIPDTITTLMPGFRNPRLQKVGRMMLLVIDRMPLLSTYMGCAVRILLFLTSTVLFLKSRKEAYSQADIKVTYTLLKYDVDNFWTILLQCMSLSSILVFVTPDYVRSLIQPLFSIQSCGPSSCLGIIKLVLGHLKAGWKEHISDAATYRMFNDQRGRLTLRSNECEQDLGWSLMVPFDESVLLWHMATDFCFYSNVASPDHQCDTEQSMPDTSGPGQCQCGAWCKNSPHYKQAVQCREMSNYMMHLLYLNPEMLMVGARRHLFTATYQELLVILKGETAYRLEDRELTQMIIAEVQSAEDSREGFVKNAHALAEALLSLGDEKMWKVIQGVWVEKLCFSAARCRGYLHAKSLGTGAELLNYIWLLMSYMGMETFAEKLQTAELPSGGNSNATSSTSEVRTGPTSSASKVPAGAGAASTSEVPAGAAAASTSEICIAVD